MKIFGNFSVQVPETIVINIVGTIFMNTGAGTSWKDQKESGGWIYLLPNMVSSFALFLMPTFPAEDLSYDYKKL